MKPRTLIQRHFYLSVLFVFFFVSYVVVCSFSVFVPNVFSNGSVIPHHPGQHGCVCLVIENFYIYVSYFFFLYFLYGYLLRNVVYNTVVCINTIIYFSMGEKKTRFKGK